MNEKLTPANWIYDEDDVRDQIGVDASDESSVSKGAREAADREADLDYILKEPRGRRFLWYMIHEVCHKDALSHVPGDPHTSAFNEGSRSVGEALDALLRINRPAKYLQMMEENIHVD